MTEPEACQMPAPFRPIITYPGAWMDYAADLTSRIRALGGRGFSKDRIVGELRLLVDEGNVVLELLTRFPMVERTGFERFRDTVARGAAGLSVLEERDDEEARGTFVSAMEGLMAWEPPRTRRAMKASAAHRAGRPGSGAPARGGGGGERPGA
jgi:hypothetical protein